MKKIVNTFSRGDFLVQDAAPELFAIFGGKKYRSNDTAGKYEYSLIAYCDSGLSYILDVGSAGSDDCNYVICEDDLNCWRKASGAEKMAILKHLSESGYAFDESGCVIRKLRENEVISFNGVNSKTTSDSDDKVGFMYDDFGYEVNAHKEWRQEKPITSINRKNSLILKAHCYKLIKEEEKKEEERLKKISRVFFTNNAFDVSALSKQERRQYRKLCKIFGDDVAAMHMAEFI